MSQGKLLGGMEYIIAAESVRNYHMNFTRLYRDKIYITSPDMKKLQFLNLIKVFLKQSFFLGLNSKCFST